MFASTFRWLQRKKYQYEVTFSLYMLTPTEKFIFNSFIFLFFSMILIAACLYLPQHIAFLTNRAWFYYHGDDAKAVLGPLTSATNPTAVETPKTVLRMLEKESLKVAASLQSAGQDTGGAEL